jgi:hypothetical protein
MKLTPKEEESIEPAVADLLKDMHMQAELWKPHKAPPFGC